MMAMITKRDANPRRPGPPADGEHISGIRAYMRSKLIGQDEIIDQILEVYRIYAARIHTPTKPLGSFVLMGPTGVGKTRVVEVLAEALHGECPSGPKVLKIECAEYSRGHEVLKLTGAPPSYLGHRETTALLHSQKLQAVTSDKCDVSIILFDEIEKAAPDVFQLTLGMLDRGTLTLGDNSVTRFNNSLIFFTTNLSEKEINKAANGGTGFAPAEHMSIEKRRSMSNQSMITAFTPEFRNRIDRVLTFGHLTPAAITEILHLELTMLQARLSFTVSVKPCALAFLSREGFSAEFGARHLKRTVDKHLAQGLATVILNSGPALPQSVAVRLNRRKDGLDFCVEAVCE